MKRILTATLFSVAMFTAANADDVARDYLGGTAIGSTEVYISREDAYALYNYNRQAFEAYRAKVKDEGGCNAPELSVYFATYCNREVFGYPQIGSEGGSD